MNDRTQQPALRRGWTTGACATAAAKAAFQALITGEFPDPVTITLPRGETPSFALAKSTRMADFAQAAIVKDAGDDPDVTHGALIVATVRHGTPGSGVVFRAGPGVGTVTRAGLPIPPGDPAINPAPRAMMKAAITETAAIFQVADDICIEISIPDGERIALKTLNPRLGIVGGLSILGTTGIVVPYSCSAWIHSIYRGIDVARAAGLTHIAGATGSVSENAIRQFHALPDHALIDMGDFVGGMLKYIRNHPVRRVTVAGGFAKITKLGQGLLDLHSKRGDVDLDWLAARLRDAGGSEDLAAQITAANTALEARQLASAGGIDLAARVVDAAWVTAAQCLDVDGVDLDIVVVDRDGVIIGGTGLRAVH